MGCTCLQSQRCNRRNVRLLFSDPHRKSNRLLPLTALVVVVVGMRARALARSRQLARAKLQERLDATRRRMLEETRLREEAKQRHEELMYRINIGALETPEDISAAMEHDWRRMNPYTLLITRQELPRVRDALLQRFKTLDEIHKRYGSFAQGDAFADMSFNDFVHFVHDSHLLNMRNESHLAAVKQVFIVSLRTHMSARIAC